MKQEEKDLLLKDLCARLPYGVKCSFGVDDAVYEITGINPTCCGASEIQATHIDSSINGDFRLSSCKPYLFPLSSMTNELWVKEFNGFGITRDFFEHGCESLEFNDCNPNLLDMVGFINQLIRNHFDIYGLIPKRLALDATGLNIY